MEKAVKSVSVSTILPATYKPSSPVARRIDLTPWDLQFLNFGPIQCGLVFSSCLVPESLQRLKESLSRTLDFFYPLAGRLCSINDVSKDSTLFYIECNNAGVKFTHAVAEKVTMADVLQPVYDMSTITLLFPESAFGRGYKHFLAVQVTELGNGWFFLGCSMSHVFGDGSSFWHFINSWSEICRSGGESLKNPPVLERWYPGQTEIWIPNELIATQPLSEGRSSQPICKERIFIFPKEKISSLKQKVIQETGNQKISSLQSMLAILLKLTSRYRQVRDDDSMIFIMPIGVRTKTKPPMSEFYLGNAVYSAVAIFTIKELRAQDALCRAASAVHNLITSLSAATFKDFVANWVEKPHIPRLGGLAKKITAMTNSPRFNVYVNDFGWGRPVAVRSGGAAGKIEGRITIYEGPENGSVHMEICLSDETLHKLVKDREFLDIVQL